MPKLHGGLFSRHASPFEVYVFCGCRRKSLRCYVRRDLSSMQGKTTKKEAWRPKCAAPRLGYEQNKKCCRTTKIQAQLFYYETLARLMSRALSRKWLTHCTRAGGSLGYSTISLWASSWSFNFIWAVVTVDETSGSTASRTSYQLPDVLQETGWEIFTIRAEEESMVKGNCFCIYVWFYFTLFCCSTVRLHIIPCVECRHSISHGSLVASWYVLRIFYYIFLYALLALLLCTWYLVAGVCTLCLSYPALQFVSVLSD